jgi:hypothetical protein
MIELYDRDARIIRRSMAAMEKRHKLFQPGAEAEAGLNVAVCGNQMPKHVRCPSKMEYVYKYSEYGAITEHG